MLGQLSYVTESRLRAGWWCANLRTFTNRGSAAPRAGVRDGGGPKSRAWTASGTPGGAFVFFPVIQKNEIRQHLDIDRVKRRY